jgi:peroxiredoxin family protein
MGKKKELSSLEYLQTRLPTISDSKNKEEKKIHKKNVMSRKELRKASKQQNIKATSIKHQESSTAI